MKKENNEKGKELLKVKHKAVNYIQNPEDIASSNSSTC